MARKRVPRGTSAVETAARIDRLERGRQVIEYARQGYTYAEIGQALGIGLETARQDALAAISRSAEANKDAAKIFITDAVIDLADIWRANVQSAKEGNDKAAHTVDRAIHRIALLLGAYPADTPSENNNTQVNLIVNVQQPPAYDDNTTPTSTVVVGSVSSRQLTTPTTDDTL